jgi:hypothetical protein
MKTWGSGGIPPPLLTAALDGGEWSPSRPGHFTPKEIAPGVHWIGGWVGPRSSPDAVEKKNLAPARAVQHVAMPTEPSRFLMTIYFSLSSVTYLDTFRSGEYFNLGLCNVMSEVS